MQLNLDSTQMTIRLITVHAAKLHFCYALLQVLDLNSKLNIKIVNVLCVVVSYRCLKNNFYSLSLKFIIPTANVVFHHMKNH